MGKGGNNKCERAQVAMDAGLSAGAGAGAAAATAPEITEAWATQLYGQGVEGVESVVHTCIGSAEPNGNLLPYWVLCGGLRDSASGESIGGWSRQLNLRADGWEAYHGRLKVDESHRGRGIARALLAQQEAAYRQAGVVRIKLTAEWHGCALWPTLGFEPDDPEECRDSVWDYTRMVLTDHEQWVRGRGEDLLEQLVAEGRVNQQLAQQARDIWAEPQRDAPLDLAAAAMLGRDQAWKTATNRDMWVGRALLCGSEFEATKPLT